MRETGAAEPTAPSKTAEGTRGEGEDRAFGNRNSAPGITAGASETVTAPTPPCRASTTGPPPPHTPSLTALVLRPITPPVTCAHPPSRVHTPRHVCTPPVACAAGYAHPQCPPPGPVSRAGPSTPPMRAPHTLCAGASHALCPPSSAAPSQCPRGCEGASENAEGPRSMCARS